MTSDVYTSPLITDDDIDERVRRFVPAAEARRFWLLFLGADRRQLPTIVPVDGIPEFPAPDDAVRLAPMFDWLADAEGAESVIVVHERLGGAEVTGADAAWTRALRAAARRAELTVRASILVHSGGTRWIAPDDWL